MVQALSELTIGQLTGSATLLLAAAATLVQVAPIKLNPWSWVARKIGRAINGEVMDEVASLKKDIQGVKKEIEDVKESDAERDAKAARARILQFGDELIHDEHHSKEHFDDVLQDMDDYERYCRAHPDFKNNRTHATTQHILEIYHKCMEEHSFL